MKRRTGRHRRRRGKPHVDQLFESGSPVHVQPSKFESLNSFYKAGPVFGLVPERENETTSAQAQSHLEEKEVWSQVGADLDVRRQGDPEEISVYGKMLKLRGKTKARFDGGRYRVVNLNMSKAEGCGGCKVKHCIHATGTLVATYSVRTTVKLPKVSDYPKLTPCQKKRVQDAITNILAPHEQQHVKAFKTYNGTTKRPFALTLCRKKLRPKIKAMFKAEERARRSAAKAASARLDPFFVKIDMNCKDASAAMDVGGMSGPKMASRAVEVPETAVSPEEQESAMV